MPMDISELLAFVVKNKASDLHLSAGLPPVAALATNKMQSVVGTGMAALTYWRRGFVSIKALIPAIALTYAGSLVGAMVVRQIDVSLLDIAVPVALIGIAVYFLFAPNLSDADKAARLPFGLFVPLMGAAIGFYDGIFGPGTGSFFKVSISARSACSRVSGVCPGSGIA